MKRILVLGNGGSGKSTFSEALGNKTGIPVVHLDSYYWKPGWAMPGNDEWLAILESLLQKDSWIMDGNYRHTIDMRLEQADTVFFLDIPTGLCLNRIYRRALFPKQRIDTIKGCRERVDREFLKWVMNYSREIRPELISKLESVIGEKKVFIFQSKKEIAEYLSSLP